MSQEELNNDSMVSEILRAYLNKGFGSMNKNDFEVWIFAQLMKGELRGKSNYEISKTLKIPETKVKRLAYEAQLKYSDDKAFADRLSAILEKSTMKDGKILTFIVEDVAMRKWLDSILKDKGLFADGSFNSEIVKVNAKGFAEILNVINPEVAELLKNKLNKEDLADAVSSLFMGAANVLAGETAGGVVSMAFNQLHNYLKK